MALFVFAAAWLLRVAHGYAAHAGHGHERPVCSAAHAGSDKIHLHDERYAANDCPVCAFWFAVPELPSITVLQSHQTILAATAAPEYQSADVRRTPEANFRRGPPASPSC